MIFIALEIVQQSSHSFEKRLTVICSYVSWFDSYDTTENNDTYIFTQCQVGPLKWKCFNMCVLNQNIHLSLRMFDSRIIAIDKESYLSYRCLRMRLKRELALTVLSQYKEKSECFISFELNTTIVLDLVQRQNIILYFLFVLLRIVEYSGVAKIFV